MDLGRGWVSPFVLPSPSVEGYGALYFIFQPRSAGATDRYFCDNFKFELAGIAFTVQPTESTTDSSSVDQVLVFDTVVYNHGNAYNKTTGHFTAPVAGYYLLHMVIGPMTFSNVLLVAMFWISGDVSSGFQS